MLGKASGRCLAGSRQFLITSYVDAGQSWGRCWAELGADAEQGFGVGQIPSWQAIPGHTLGRCWAELGADAEQGFGVGQISSSSWPHPRQVLGRAWELILRRAWADDGQTLLNHSEAEDHKT